MEAGLRTNSVHVHHHLLSSGMGVGVGRGSRNSFAILNARIFARAVLHSKLRWAPNSACLLGLLGLLGAAAAASSQVDFALLPPPCRGDPWGA